MQEHLNDASKAILLDILLQEAKRPWGRLDSRSSTLKNGWSFGVFSCSLSKSSEVQRGFTPQLTHAHFSGASCTHIRITMGTWPAFPCCEKIGTSDQVQSIKGVNLPSTPTLTRTMKFSRAIPLLVFAHPIASQQIWDIVRLLRYFKIFITDDIT